MPSIQKRSARIFYSYAHEDKELRDELAKHLGRSYIDSWHDREILAGQNWEDEIDTYLETADIILLLISVDFMNSNYCMGKEMRRAVERSELGEAAVIPVILRSCNWQTSPFRKLQALPPPGTKTISDRPDREEAFREVAQGIRNTINNVLKKGYLADAKTATNAGRYEDTCVAYDRLIHLFPQDPSFRKERGDILLHLEHFEEALKEFKEAIYLDPENAQFYVSKGMVLARQKKFTEALVDYKRAVELGISDFLVYKEMGDMLHTLGRHEEALDAYERAIKLSPRMPQLFVNRGDILVAISNYEAALREYEKAIKLEPKNAQLWRQKGQFLVYLGRLPDARAAYEVAIGHETQNAYLHKEYGDILMKLKDASGALVAYDDAIRCQHDYSLAYRGKGEALALMAQQYHDRLMQLSDAAFKQAEAIERAIESNASDKE